MLVGIHISSPAKPPSHHPTILPLKVVTYYWAELSVLQSSFPLAIYMGVYICQFLQPSLSPAMFTSLFFLSASLFLPCKLVHQYHFSRFSSPLFPTLLGHLWDSPFCLVARRVLCMWLHACASEYTWVTDLKGQTEDSSLQIWAS